MATIEDRPFSKNYSGLINQSVIAIGLGAICITAYEFMKRRRRGRRVVKGLDSVETWEFGYLYQGRSWAKRPSPPHPQGWPLSWVKEVVNFPESGMNKLRGVDATLYVRFLRGCAWFTFLHTFTTVPILLPIHVHFSDETVSPRSMTRASISSLVLTQDGSNLLWIHLILLYYITLTWMATILWICRGAFAYRHANIQDTADRLASAAQDEHSARFNPHPHPQYPFLSSVPATDDDGFDRGLRLRSVMVTNVPRSLRSEKELAEYFQYYLSRPIDVPYIGLPSAAQPGFLNTSMAFLFNRVKRIPELIPHRNEGQSDNGCNPRMDGRQVPVIDRVIIARKMTELQSLLERREDFLRRLEVAHIKLAKRVLFAVKEILDERENGKPLIKRLTSRMSLHRLSHPHDKPGANTVATMTHDNQGEGEDEDYTDLLLRELTPFVDEFGLRTRFVTRNNVPQPFAKRVLGFVRDLFHPPRIPDEKYRHISDTNGRTIWDVLHSLPRRALDPYQPLIRLRTLFHNTTVASIDYYNAKYALLTNLITEHRAKAVADYDPVSTAFVTFADPRDARRACRYLAVNPDNPLACFVTMAPGYEDLDWTRVMKASYRVEFVKDWVVDIGVWAFTLFWVFPVTFFVGLVSIQNISAFWPGLNHYLDHHPWEEELIQSLLPTVLVALLSILIPLILLLIGKKAHTLITLSELHDRIMARYYKFLIVNVLVFFCVGTATLQSFLVSFASKANHQNVLEIISSSFPSAGPFYVGWMIFTTGMHGGIELVLFGLPLFMYPSTKRQATPRKRSVGIRPRTFNYYYWLPNHMLVVHVLLLFTVLNPLVVPFGFVYFMVQSTVIKNQLLHVYAKNYEGNGQHLLIRMIRYSLDGLVLSQAVFLAYMAVLKKRANVGLSAVLIILTVLMKLLLTHACRAKFERDDMWEASIVCGTEEELVDDNSAGDRDSISNHREDAGSGAQPKTDFSQSWKHWKTWRLRTEVVFSYATYSGQGRRDARRQPNPFATSQSSFARLQSIDGLRSKADSLPTSESVNQEQSKGENAAPSPPSSSKTPIHLAEATATALVTPHPPHPAWDDESDPCHPYENPYYKQPISNTLWLPRNPCNILNLDETVDVQRSLTTTTTTGQLGLLFTSGAPHQQTPSIAPPPPLDRARSSSMSTARRFDGSEVVSLPPRIASRINAPDRDENIEDAQERRPTLLGRRRRSSERSTVGTARSSASLHRPHTFDVGPSIMSRIRTTSGISGMRPQFSAPSSFRSAIGRRMRGRSGSLTQELGLREDPGPRPNRRIQGELFPTVSQMLANPSLASIPTYREREPTAVTMQEAVEEEALVEERVALEERLRREAEEAQQGARAHRSWLTRWLFARAE